MTVRSEMRRWIPTITLAVAVLGCAVYLPALRAQFTFDDVYIIVDNPLVTGEAGLADIFTSHYWAGEDVRGNLYRPLVVLSYRLNFLVAGLSPWSFHLVNLLLHGLVCAMVLHLARRLSGSLSAGIATAVLFATHPIHSEAVVSAVGRAELMAAAFVLGAWLWRDRRLVSLLLFVCGLLCKESAVVFPVLLAVEDLMRGRLRVSLRQLAPATVITGLFVAGRLLLLDPSAGDPQGPFAGVSSVYRILTAIDVFGRYVGLLFWPADLSADYSFNQIPIVTTLLSPGVAAGVTAAVVLLAAAFFMRKFCAAVVTGLLLFLAALLPVSNLVIGIGVIMAERLVYLPSLGLCLGAGALMVAAAKRAGSRRAVIVGCLIVTAPSLIFAVMSWKRAEVWRSPLSLFEATVETSPRSGLAWFGLGSAYQRIGRLDQAEEAFVRSVEIAPHRSQAWFNLGVLYEAAGRDGEAVNAYEEAVRANPEDHRAHNNVGILYQAAGRLEDAEAAFRRATVAGGGRAEPAYNLGTILEATGRGDEAITWYQMTIAEDPDHVMALNNLGRQLIIAGRLPEAITMLEQVVSLEPDGVLPRVNLAAALYETGDLSEAEVLVRSVLVDDPQFAPAQSLLERINAEK